MACTSGLSSLAAIHSRSRSVPCCRGGREREGGTVRAHCPCVAAPLLTCNSQLSTEAGLLLSGEQLMCQPQLTSRQRSVMCSRSSSARLLSRVEGPTLPSVATGTAALPLGTAEGLPERWGGQGRWAGKHEEAGQAGRQVGPLLLSLRRMLLGTLCRSRWPHLYTGAAPREGEGAPRRTPPVGLYPPSACCAAAAGAIPSSKSSCRSAHTPGGGQAN